MCSVAFGPSELPSREALLHLIGQTVQGSLKIENERETIADNWLVATQLSPEQLNIIVEVPSERCVHWVNEISLTSSLSRLHPPSWSILTTWSF